MATLMSHSRRVIGRVLRAALALAAAGTLGLMGCSRTKDAAMDAGKEMGQMAEKATSGVGDAAKDAASGAAQTALAPAVNPVLDLLRQGKEQVEQGNLAAAVATMGGFEALWAKASPVIQPLAGDKWPAIEAAAKQVSAVFPAGATPDGEKAGAAISGLMGPLKALMGQ
jgi:hypothetical protein